MGSVRAASNSANGRYMRVILRVNESKYSLLVDRSRIAKASYLDSLGGFVVETGPLNLHRDLLAADYFDAVMAERDSRPRKGQQWREPPLHLPPVGSDRVKNEIIGRSYKPFLFHRSISRSEEHTSE